MGFDAEKTDPLYKHVPFYICENSVGAYGIYYDTTDTSFVDLGREINNYYCHFTAICSLVRQAGFSA